MQAFSIAPYTDADFELVTAIWFDSALTMGVALPVTLGDLRERWPKEIAGGWRVHVLRMDGGIVAFIAITASCVQQLFVSPQHQGQGIGKCLLDFAKTRMPDGFYLTTPMVGRAVHFYEREGLTRGEISRHRFGHENVRYDWRP